ncbi:MAG TPA: OmpH family outer membrane protein [Candidatus Omnitrophota bacterium]|nr:OmpH family outer membrane protein [Candidatus Omnitrophota bacterium]HPN88212.1 OmpH family outer membrane protein [Candidatus Omnitrophota bacterium]
MQCKKIVVLVAVIFLSFILVGNIYAADKDLKVGFADLSKLFDDYYKTKEFDKVLEDKHAGFVKERDKKIEKIKEAQGKVALLKEEEKAKVEKDIEQMKAELLEFDRQQKETLTQERNDKIREILLEIEKVVSDYAEKEGYSFILNDRVLIYGNKTIDITPLILDKLNQGQKGKK